MADVEAAERKACEEILSAVVKYWSALDSMDAAHAAHRRARKRPARGEQTAKGPQTRATALSSEIEDIHDCASRLAERIVEAGVAADVAIVRKRGEYARPLNWIERFRELHRTTTGPNDSRLEWAEEVRLMTTHCGMSADEVTRLRDDALRVAKRHSPRGRRGERVVARHHQLAGAESLNELFRGSSSRADFYLTNQYLLPKRGDRLRRKFIEPERRRAAAAAFLLVNTLHADRSVFRISYSIAVGHAA